MITEAQILEIIEQNGFGGDRARDAARQIHARSQISGVLKATLIEQACCDVGWTHKNLDRLTKLVEDCA